MGGKLMSLNQLDQPLSEILKMMADAEWHQPEIYDFKTQHYAKTKTDWLRALAYVLWQNYDLSKWDIAQLLGISPTTAYVYEHGDQQDFATLDEVLAQIMALEEEYG
jgi:hypothetical protein